jgi:glycyl-tRNA synthetase
MAKTSTQTLDNIISLAKRRGFVFQSSEIYGGLNGCWDYGPLGVELLRNVKEAWWKAMTYREDVEGLDASILMHPRVWEASGHVQNFSDPMVDCRQCKARYRTDQLLETLSVKKRKELLRWYATTLADATRINDIVQHRDDAAFAAAFDTEIANETTSNALILSPEMACPNCGNKGTFTEPRQFNLMFKTFVGPVEDASNAVFLRPETAQGIFVNFKNVMEGSRQRPPFGIAQIGKAFRNEINTKNFLFRTREFEQMEMQFFVKPGSDTEWFEQWRHTRWQWFVDHGMKPEKMRWHEHEKLAHYARAAYDIEYQFPFGWGEIEGIHNRTDFDLKRHEEFSGKKLEYVDTATKDRFTPFVIETSAGASRSFFAFLCDAYHEEEAPTAEEGKTESRVVLRFHPKLAPLKVAVFPLVNKDGMPEFARKLYGDVQKHHKAFYDDSGAVGRRYRRQDEVGTPYCVTIDGQSLQDHTVTIRERDTMVQERISADRVAEIVTTKIAG